MKLGILNPLYDLVAWLIMHIHAVLAVPLGPASGVTWVLTIVVLVVLMRLILLPLFVKQMHAQRKMVVIAPKMQELRKRYKGDKQKLNEEMMKLYKEAGANPLSGCLPLLAQLPLWFALLNVLKSISEHKHDYGMTQTVVAQANHARIFGVTISDRFLFGGSTPDVKIVIGITVVLSAVTTYFSVRQSVKRGLMQAPTTDDNPMAGAQKYMAYIAPLFALSGLYWQYGLVVYWLTSNVWQVGQQYFLFKKIPPLNAATGAAGGAAAVTGRPAGAAAPGITARPKPGGGAAASRRPAQGTKQPGNARAPAARQAPPTARQGPPPGQPAAGQPKAAGGAAADGQAAQPRPAPAGSQAPKPGGPPPKKRAAAQAEAATLGVPPPTSNGSGGVLRKLVRGRAEPEPEPEPQPQVTFVRQQRQRQSRSKRTGKR